MAFKADFATGERALVQDPRAVAIADRIFALLQEYFRKHGMSNSHLLDEYFNPLQHHLLDAFDPPLYFGLEGDFFKNVVLRAFGEYAENTSLQSNDSAVVAASRNSYLSSLTQAVTNNFDSAVESAKKNLVTPQYWKSQATLNSNGLASFGNTTGAPQLALQTPNYDSYIVTHEIDDPRGARTPMTKRDLQAARARDDNFVPPVQKIKVPKYQTLPDGTEVMQLTAAGKLLAAAQRGAQQKAQKEWEAEEAIFNLVYGNRYEIDEKTPNQGLDIRIALRKAKKQARARLVEAINADKLPAWLEAEIKNLSDSAAADVQEKLAQYRSSRKPSITAAINIPVDVEKNSFDPIKSAAERDAGAADPLVPVDAEEPAENSVALADVNFLQAPKYEITVDGTGDFVIEKPTTDEFTRFEISNPPKSVAPFADGNSADNAALGELDFSAPKANISLNGDVVDGLVTVDMPETTDGVANGWLNTFDTQSDFMTKQFAAPTKTETETIEAVDETSVTPKNEADALIGIALKGSAKEFTHALQHQKSFLDLVDARSFDLSKQLGETNLADDERQGIDKKIIEFDGLAIKTQNLIISVATVASRVSLSSIFNGKQKKIKLIASGNPDVICDMSTPELEKLAPVMQKMLKKAARKGISLEP